jgi:competence protein ComEA
MVSVDGKNRRMINFHTSTGKGDKMKKSLLLLVLFGLLFGLHSPLWADEGAKINVNTATVEELTDLQKVGVKTAERIVAYRQANGPFETVADLKNVKGIGDKILVLNQNRLTVGN